MALHPGAAICGLKLCRLMNGSRTYPISYTMCMPTNSPGIVAIIFSFVMYRICHWYRVRFLLYSTVLYFWYGRLCGEVITKRDKYSIYGYLLRVQHWFYAKNIYLQEIFNYHSHVLYVYLIFIYCLIQLCLESHRTPCWFLQVYIVANTRHMTRGCNGLARRTAVRLLPLIHR